MLSNDVVSTHIQYRGSNLSRLKTTKGYPEKVRYEAVALYKLLGSLNAVAKELEIPYITLRKWHISDWWKDYELDIIQSNRAKSNSKVQKIVEKAMVVVEDRLDSGDYQFDQKTGKMVRVPVKAEVANRILQDSMNREIMNEKLNQEAKRNLTEEKMSDRLLKIQESFKAIKAGKRIQGESTDADYVDIVEEVVADPILDLLPELPSPTTD